MIGSHVSGLVICGSVLWLEMWIVDLVKFSGCSVPMVRFMFWLVPMFLVPCMLVIWCGFWLVSLFLVLTHNSVDWDMDCGLGEFLLAFSADALIGLPVLGSGLWPCQLWDLNCGLSKIPQSFFFFHFCQCSGQSCDWFPHFWFCLYHWSGLISDQSPQLGGFLQTFFAVALVSVEMCGGVVRSCEELWETYRGV